MTTFVSSTSSRNNIIFGISMALLHIATSLIYGLCISNSTSYINITSVLAAIALALLTIAGFGLVFSYLRQLSWSGIGFAFLITALSIELYPLFNAFWSKVAIEKTPTLTNFSSKFFTLYLSNFDLPTGANYANTITTCFKCALSVLAAFSCILGRAGALQCLIVSIFGICGFQLNRQIIANLAVDSFGTFSIFTFGGFMGLALGLILRFKEDRTEGCSTEKHIRNTASPYSVSLATFGALIVFTFFPFLALDLDAFHGINAFNVYTGPFYVIVAMGAAIIGAIIVSCLINGYLISRDLIHAPIAGGIIAGSASFYITNPVYALVVGFMGGAIQAAIQNLVEKQQWRHRSVVSTISWSLFGIQGLLGGVFATGYANIINSNSNGITFSTQSTNYNPGYELLIAVISAGIGLGFGALAGALIYFVSGQTHESHFDDGEYWINNDGIGYQRLEGLEVIVQGRGIPPVKRYYQAEGPIDQEEYSVDLYFQEIEDNSKDNAAML